MLSLKAHAEAILGLVQVHVYFCSTTKKQNRQTVSKCASILIRELAAIRMIVDFIFPEKMKRKIESVLILVTAKVLLMFYNFDEKIKDIRKQVLISFKL